MALVGGAAVRLHRAIDPPAAGAVRSGGDVLRAATDLDDASVAQSVGLSAPGRSTEDQPDGASTRRTWFAAGRWWAVLGGGPDGSLHIWALSGSAGPWIDTGLVVDDRPFAQPWVQWTGDTLLITTSGDRDYRSHGLRASRYSWDAERQTWSRAADFPVQVTEAGVPGTQVVVDGQGRAWMARLDGDRLLVAHSDAQNLSYTPFAPLPDGLAATDVGGFSLAADEAGLHLAWRSVTTDRLTVASGTDGAWKAETHTVYGVGGRGTVDAVPAGPDRPGELVVLVSSSLPQRGSNDQDPSLLVLDVRGDEVVTSVAAVSVDHLRSPRLVVDADAGRVHVVAVADPLDTTTGYSTVVDKAADLSDLAFPGGNGSVLLRAKIGSFATPSVPSQIGGGSGLLVVASGDDVLEWRTAQVGGPKKPAATGAAPDATLVHDTFDQRRAGDPPPLGWYAGGKQPLTASIVGSPAGGRGLSVTDADGVDPPSACREVPATAATRVVVRAVVRPTALGTSDVRLLTVKGAGGSLASVRLTRKGLLGYSSPGGRVDQGPVPTGSTLRVTVVIDRGRRSADISVAIDGGATVFAVAAQPLLAAPGAGPDEVCFAPPPGGAGASLVLDDLLVTSG
ncbi:hypothetical protein BH10ACT1_BH10ACT1_22650 [soil metagenome]